MFLGPASVAVETLESMIDSGMNVGRLNFSHGSHEYHANTIKNLRQAAENYSKKIGLYCPLAIALDTKGPEIRTGLLEGVCFFLIHFYFYVNSISKILSFRVVQLKLN